MTEVPPSLPDAARTDTPGALALAIEAARVLHDNKCDNILLFDVRALSSVTDYMVIASGTSNRQMNAALQHVQDMGAERGSPVFRCSADDRSLWLVCDFVDVVVHVFEPNTRAYYDLEMLWGDAPQVAWGRGAGPSPAGPGA
ncbi:MAG: ribosome silencing factor [Phycisphaerales bacterium]|nr:ribosome silencing factor [Phycisphaerales bacterium]